MQGIGLRGSGVTQPPYALRCCLPPSSRLGNHRKRKPTPKTRNSGWSASCEATFRTTFYLTIDTSQRWRDPVFGADQQTFRVTLETGTIGEARLHQQFRYAKGGLDLRTRFEQRWFEGADQVELRVRQRVQYTHTLGNGIKALGSSEWFAIIQSRRIGKTAGTEQVRNIIGVAIPLGANLDIQPSYMLQITPRENRPDAISHVPQVTLNYKF
jgi:hypothetical protein